MLEFWKSVVEKLMCLEVSFVLVIKFFFFGGDRNLMYFGWVVVFWGVLF